MKELAIYHFPKHDENPSRVRLSYRSEIGAQPQEREAEFKFTIEDEKLRMIRWYLEEFLIYPWGEFLNRASQVEQMLSLIGAELFNAVFINHEMLALYAHISDDLANTRIVIHASGPAGVALPWELLRDPTRGEYGDLARLAYAFSRSQPDLFFEPIPMPMGDTFNILMVICRPGGPERDVPFQSVSRPLLELFRPHRDRIHLDVLRPPTFEQLTRVLGDSPNFYHVLHFDGHGTFPMSSHPPRFFAQQGEHGKLIFEGEDGNPREVSGEELGKLLAGRGVPIVLLNACQSGMTHPESLYPSVGNQLLKAGARGVVAMAYSVYVQTAVRFMARLYEVLINGEELARAVALAREDLFANPQHMSPIGEIKLRDWMVPILFEAAPVRVMERGERIRLDPNILDDQQEKVGKEIDCPETPMFGFVGRDSVILELERVFQHETIVLLEGMAGVGKTEMAVGFARWRAETGSLDGPIFFFNFENYLPLERVIDRVGHEFHAIVHHQLGRDLHMVNTKQRRQVVLQILRQLPCLMIWDNFDSVEGFPTGTESEWKSDQKRDLREFLRDLRGGQTKVLITSRRDEPWLTSIYHHLELHGLELREAQELAVRVLRRAGLNPEQIRRLPQYNDLLIYLRGNPLAIQVILPELKQTTPDTLLHEIRSGEAALSIEDPTLGRERSLTASLTYRFNKLNPTLRRRLGVLGLFQGLVKADALAAICQQVEDAPQLIRGLGREEWNRMLNVAREVGLLRSAGKDTYIIHPALPWFFNDILSESFPNDIEWLEHAFIARCSSSAIRLFNLFNTQAENAINWLRAEENNLTHAFYLSQKHENWEAALAILFGLRRLYETQGQWVELERLVTNLDNRFMDEQGEPLPGREDQWMKFLSFRLDLAGHSRNVDAQKSILNRLRAYYDQIGNIEGQAAVLNDLGLIFEKHRQFSEAEECYRECLAINKRIGDEDGISKNLHNLGILLRRQRRYKDAESLLQQSLSFEEQTGNEHGKAISLLELGNLAMDLKQLEKAEQRFHQSMRIFMQIGDKQFEAKSVYNLGAVTELREQHEEAERLYRKSLKIFNIIGDEEGQAIVCAELGLLAFRHQQTQEAARWFQKALDFFRGSGDEEREALTILNLGATLVKERKLDKADQMLRQSLAIAERLGLWEIQADCLFNLGCIAEVQDKISEAIRFFEQAETLVTYLNDSQKLSEVREALRSIKEK